MAACTKLYGCYVSEDILNFSIDARFFSVRDRRDIIAGSAVSHSDMCGLVWFGWGEGGSRMCSKVNTRRLGNTEIFFVKKGRGEATSGVSVCSYGCSLPYCCEIVANMNGYTFLHNSLEKPVFRFHGVNCVSIRARPINNEMLSTYSRTEVKGSFFF